MAAVEKTKCIPPSSRDGGAGQLAAVWRSLLKGLLAGAATAAATTAMVALVLRSYAEILGGVAGGTVTGLIAADGFLDWWLNRRLLCLGGDRYAIGIVWIAERPEKKSFPEYFDDDYSVSLVLSPLAPGDPVSNQPGTMWELVHHQPSIEQSGVPTFGYNTVAARSGWRVARVISPEFKDDSDNLFRPLRLPGTPNNRWEAVVPRRSELPLPAFLEAWELKDSSSFDIRDRIEVPDTQLLHCEFEGTTIYYLRKWLPVIAGVSAVIASGLVGMLTSGALAGGALAGVGTAGAFALGLLAALFLFFLAALLIKGLSHHGNPADANISDGSDRNAGNIRDVDRPDPSRASAAVAQRWDVTFDLIGVMGRWVYDFGHSRGWNELHPVKYAELLTTEDFDVKLRAAGKPPVRPTNENDAGALLKIFQAEVERAMAVTAQQQLSASYSVHPSVG